MTRWSTLAIAVPLVCLGCSQQARIVMQDGSTVRGRIVDHRDGVLVIEGPSRRGHVPRERVREIYHPGVPAMVVGGIVLATGALLFTASALGDCSERRTTCKQDPGNPDGCNEMNFDLHLDFCEPARAAGMILGGGAAATGLGVGLYGFGVHQSSRARAEALVDGHAPRLDEARALRVSGRF